jgi:hypothetical protein
VFISMWRSMGANKSSANLVDTLYYLQGGSSVSWVSRG